jgi:hypothetical protein
MASVFADLPAAAPIEVFELTAAFNADKHPQKVNLGVGGEPQLHSLYYYCIYSCSLVRRYRAPPGDITDRHLFVLLASKCCQRNGGLIC